MKFVETRSGRIYYWQTMGSTTKPVLVFLHGLSSNHTTWSTAVALAHQAGYGTLALDLRGHGLSDKTRRRALYTIPQMSADLATILTHEKITNFVLVGYSYGAYVALDFATSQPYPHPAALVLVSANHVSPFAYHWCWFLSPVAYWLTTLLGYLLIWQSWKKYHYFEAASKQTYWQSTFTGFATMPLSINFWMLAQVFRLDYQDTLGRILCPTLLIKSPDDSFVTEAETRDIAQKIPQAEQRSLGRGHFIATHHQELLAKHLLEFVNKL